MYDALGGVPAIDEVRFSVTHNRGCFGACTFCSLAFHQGRTITSRSHESVIRVTSGGEKVAEFRREHMAPGEMEKIMIPKVLLDRCGDQIEITVEDKEAQA